MILILTLGTLLYNYNLSKDGVEKRASALDVESFEENNLIVRSSKDKFKTYGGKVEDKNGNIYILSFDDAEKAKTAYAKFSKSTSIDSVEINEKLKTGVAKNEGSKYDSVPTSETELASFLRMQEIKKDVTVAVLDTGFDKNENTEKIIDLGLNYSTSGEKNDIQDDNSHGTELVKLILENASENVKVMPIKIADKDGISSIYNTYLGIMAAIENNADIINISMNSYNTKESKILEDAINKADNAGIKVVVSSGNDKIDTKYAIPANIDKAIIVSAVAENNLIEKYSNYGDEIDYSAYGMYNGKSGSSFAAARVAGILANAMTKGYDEGILEKYAIDLGEEGKDKHYGNGFIGLTHNEISEYTIPDDYFESTIFDDDWKKLNKEELNEKINNSTDFQLAVFLQNLSKEDLSLILSKDTKLLHEKKDYKFKTDENGNKIPVEGKENLYKVEECARTTFYKYLLELDYSSVKTNAKLYYLYNNYGACFLRIYGDVDETYTIKIVVQDLSNSLNNNNAIVVSVVGPSGYYNLSMVAVVGGALGPNDGSFLQSAQGDYTRAVWQMVYTRPAYTYATYSVSNVVDGYRFDTHNGIDPTPTGNPTGVNAYVYNCISNHDVIMQSHVLNIGVGLNNLLVTPKQSVLTISLHHPTLTVSYNSNGATSGSVPGNTVFTYDTAGTLASNSGNLVKTGYSFGRMG